jgi:hypothetical protein
LQETKALILDMKKKKGMERTSGFKQLQFTA